MIKICSDCNGTGKSFKYEGNYHNSYKVETTCNKCKGSGRLEERMIINLPYTDDNSIIFEVDKKFHEIEKILEEIHRLYEK